MLVDTSPLPEISSLLYVSLSAVAPEEANRVVGEIVAAALVHNRAQNITGALLFTGTHFAQVLEGERAALDPLMASIRSDPRHSQVLVVDRHVTEARRFAGWSLAYGGPSQFVSGHVTRLLAQPSPLAHSRAADWLADLLREFSGDRG